MDQTPPTQDVLQRKISHPAMFRLKTRREQHSPAQGWEQTAQAQQPPVLCSLTSRLTLNQPKLFLLALLLHTFQGDSLSKLKFNRLSRGPPSQM